MMSWQNILKSVVNQPLIHARFLNTLSMVEFIGARKIIKSQPESSVSMFVLSHAAEEIRHAQILKKLAIKLGGKSVQTYSEPSLIAGDLARRYIQEIDQSAGMVAGEQDSWLSYLLTTLIIEERAQTFYPVYDELMAKVNMSGPLKQIVRDEENHLEDMRKLIAQQEDFDVEQLHSLRAIENRHFQLFFAGVEEEMGRVSPMIEHASPSL
ncbi:MAG: ferritin-like domain-containing protein [Bdellovibrionales bacterium]|nr:ferritin-like domain-containing protein [Bdellovibrionales bacterium]